MKVTTIGGGPGGLYASILLKKAHPDWEVAVHERNPADETYGWGIVFPNRALPDLEEADPETHERITEQFYRWKPIDTFVDERQYRCSGHTFASMQRTNLLSVLQERCEEVGVDLHFGAAVEDPEALAAESDLVLGADGIGSTVRETWSEEFGADVVEGTDRFAWFGTDQHFEALSHSFDHNEDGLWRIHAYPGETTTFIVDCDAETWENSGLEDANEEEYLDYLEEVFAGYLDGHDIKCKDDRWWTFRTVRNETWHHDNVALMGDAAHTAHFSIGSGTTLAMGDAIALAEAFEDYDGDADVSEILAGYQAERKPFVEKIQEAAELSRVHYEHSKRYVDLADLQFTVHHLTRSGRITYDSLRRRDPEFMAGFTDWFAENTLGPTATLPDGDTAPPSFQPYAMAGVTFRNRLVLDADAGAEAVGEAGEPMGAYGDALASAASSEPGLVLTGPTAVTDAGRAASGEALPAIETDEQAEAWADAVAEAAGVTGVGATADGGDGGTALGLRLTHHTADVTNEDVPSFVGAAKRAADAGFDALELDFGLDALGAPLANGADGGDGRQTLPLEVVAAVREGWGGPLLARLPVTDDGSDYGIEDAYGAAEALVARGVDLVVTTGDVEAAPGVGSAPVTVDPAADWVRNEAEVPTVSTGGATTLDEVDTLVGPGRADLVRFVPEANGEVDLSTDATLDEELL
jgi:anthraniloyl-CoA monooxygenase